MFKRECKNCGAEFETPTYRREKCKPDCGRKHSGGHAARAQENENHEVEFIGVDGEGVGGWGYEEFYNEDEAEFQMRRIPQHYYVLLSVGDKSLHRDGRELTYHEIFTFLWEQFQENPKSAFVGFFLGYDFTEWLKTLPQKAADELLLKQGIANRRHPDFLIPFPVRDQGHWGSTDGFRYIVGAKWEFDLLANKRFKLRPYVAPHQVPTTMVTHKDGTQEAKKVTRPWMYICDAGPFFQSSFLKAIEPSPKNWKNPILSRAEYDRIKQGKESRATAGFDADMIEYNVLENDVLARLMNRVNEGFVEIGVKLRKDQWYGPGQAAQAWMKLIGVPTGEEIREAVPKYAREFARKTYYGGWFEIFGHGTIPGTSYAYDINSAYPYIIAGLPCLLHGVWSKGHYPPGKLAKGCLRMVYATLKGRDEWVGPAPHRDQHGGIHRPLETKGWHWWHEIQASKRAGLVSAILIHEWVEYQPCKCDPPMAAIADLYQGRLRDGKGSASGKGKKLVYNSSYGKLAQSVGLPKYSNPIWASLITAGCRTMILDAIATHPSKTESLLMVATDGIYFKEPHPSLDFDEERLGAWDQKTHENLSLFMPGLYWDDAARQRIREGKDPELKSRGVNARDLSTVIDDVDRRWRNLYSDPEMPERFPPPRVELKVNFAIVTAKQAVVRDAWHTAGQPITNAVRVLDGKPDNKRFNIHHDERTDGWRSLPYPRAEPLETEPYVEGFGEPVEDEDEVFDSVTPDGTVGELQAWAFGTRG